jgi:hypothetical protein
MLTVAVEAWIGNAAAGLSGTWGGVTQRAKQSGYSRTSLYQHARRVVRAVLDEHVGGMSYEALWADNERLRAENEALWQAWSEAEEISEAKQHEFASTGSAMGLSLAQIVTLLAIVLPRLSVPSRSRVGRWVHQASEQASRILGVLDRACQRWVLTVCLDEIFFHRVPIVMAVEPVRLAWVAAQRGPDRTGESWAKVIGTWPRLEHVIADGGKGIERGVKLAPAARHDPAQPPEADVSPPITMGLDVFHTQREVERVLHRQWKQVERQMEAASEADAKVVQSKRRGRDCRGMAGQAGRAWRKAEQLFDEALRAERAAGQIKGALKWFGPDGHLQSRAEVHRQLDEVCQQLHGSQWNKVKRVLSDERTLSHLDRLHKQLAEVVAEPLLRESLIRLWFLNDSLKQMQDNACVSMRPQMVLEQVLCQRLCAQWQSAYVDVDERLRHAVRASSAVEGINSVVRMHQGRHRHVSQGMLDLKRFYWNCRIFQDGKRKGWCPYDLLGLKLPTSDWWQLLQMAPEEFEQNLLTQEVAA